MIECEDLILEVQKSLKALLNPANLKTLYENVAQMQVESLMQIILHVVAKHFNRAKYLDIQSFISKHDLDTIHKLKSKYQ